MTDNEETRSYNDILADNKELRKAINAEFGRFMFEAGFDALNEALAFDCNHDADAAFNEAIEAYKAKQGRGND